jgi:lactate permease
MFLQVYDPVARSIAVSSAYAALPLLSMFLMLGWLKMSPHVSAIVSLIISMAVAGFMYHMPAITILNVSIYGAAFSTLTVLWVIVNAIWIYNLTVQTGHFEILRDSFALVSVDLRIQAILIAFSFGALIEALAGAGTPVAIAGAMLIAVGVNPIKAATIALVGDTAPVAFGALAVPITTLAQVTGLPVEQLGRYVGMQTPILAAIVPLILVWIMDGMRGLRQTWPVAVVTGIAFAVTQWFSASHFSVALSDVLASLVSATVLVIFLRFWNPKALDESSFYGETVLGNESRSRHKGSAVLLAYAPYFVVIAAFSLVQVGIVHRWFEMGTIKFAWPGLKIVDQRGAVVGTGFTLNSLSAAGSLLFISGVISAMILRVGLIKSLGLYGQTLRQLRWAVPTVLSVMALAFVMNYSGQTGTLGRLLAGTGSAFAFLSPMIGWIGVAVTGSDNSANALFGALQVSAARHTGLSPALLAAANASGGVLGKMISPQSLAVGAAAVGIIGEEGVIFRKVIGWSIVLLLAMAVVVYLQSIV